jgi:sporulation protein YlmC with PRC-barrel domain
MKAMYQWSVLAAVLLAGMLAVDVAKGQEVQKARTQDGQKDRTVTRESIEPSRAAGVSRAHAVKRASTVIGMAVKNQSGDELGKIDDLVLDMNSGKVRYAALSFGGFLGLGDKLFAVPMEALKLSATGDSAHFVLDVDKERLKNAPGFDKDMWPDFGNPEWGAGVDKFYQTSVPVRPDATEGRVQAAKFESLRENQLTITDSSGQQRRFHVGRNVRVTIDGKAAQASELNSNHRIDVTFGEENGSRVVQSINARSREQ